MPTLPSRSFGAKTLCFPTGLGRYQKAQNAKEDRLLGSSFVEALMETSSNHRTPTVVQEPPARLAVWIAGSILK